MHCELCGKPIPPHMHYIVRIDVFYNPEIPEITQEQLDKMDHDEEFRKIFEQMKHLTPEEAQAQVHRRFEYNICPACQPRFLANPLGKPRQREVGEN